MASKREKVGKDGKPVIKHIVYYTDLNGKRTSKSFDNKSKALSFEKTIQANKVAKAPPITKGHYTFEDLAEKYLIDSELGRDGEAPWRSNTIDNQRRHANKAYLYLERETPLRVLTATGMRDVRRTIQASDYARSTQISVWNFIKACLNYAVTEEIIRSNPADKITIKNLKLHEAGDEEFEVFSKDQAKAILKQAGIERDAKHGHTRSAYKFTWLIPHVLFETGIRISELLALEWKNVDLNEREIKIVQSMSKWGKKVETVKSKAGIRTLYISVALADELKKLKSSRETRFVFETATLNPLEYRNSLTWWHRLLKRASVEPLGFHAVRHYYASRLIEAGVDAKVLTTNMGHSDVAFTLSVYGHLFDDRDTREKKRAVAETLGAFAA